MENNSVVEERCGLETSSIISLLSSAKHKGLALVKHVVEKVWACEIPDRSLYDVALVRLQVSLDQLEGFGVDHSIWSNQINVLWIIDAG